mmetsp:Transcript_15040/g.22631  ORF Transcript_15040/g.22631 Transcript_15040/m.22631 type:complete len:208 (-) Transcript_15040:175-798(-)
MLKRFPKMLEWIILGGVVTAGDVVSQKLSSPSIDVLNGGVKNHNAISSWCGELGIDIFRTLGVAVTGFFYIAPLTMAWFPFLHRFMARHMSHLTEGSLAYVAMKVAIENTFLAMPVCLGFFVVPAMVEGSEQRKALPSRLSRDLMPTFYTDVAFWTLASPINYKYISVRYQPVFSCILGGVEASGLSYLTHVDGFQWPTFDTMKTIE